MILVRRAVAGLICAGTDWLERIEYRSDASTVRRFWGAMAQQVWFRAHNNRLYRWAENDS